MTELKMNTVLAEMQRLAAEAGTARSKGPDPEHGGFADLLKASVEGVNAAESRAEEMSAAFESGASSASLPEVMIALQKASLSFQAMTEVRNRLVSAYQEIMNMPI